MKLLTLVLIRFFSKLLAISSISFFSFELNWNLYAIAFLVMVFIVEILFLRRLTGLLEIILLIIFTSAISVVPCYMTSAKFWLILIFLICDIFTILSISITPFVVGVILPSILFFSANISGFFVTKEVMKNPADNFSLLVKEKLPEAKPGTITYMNGTLFSTLKIGEDYFSISVTPLKDKEIVFILIFLIFTLPLLIAVFSIYQERVLKSSKPIGKELISSATSSVGADHKVVQYSISYQVPPYKYAEEYIQELFTAIKNAINKDEKFIKEFSDELSSYVEIINQKDREVLLVKGKLLSCIQDAKRILGDCGNFPKKVENLLLLTSDFRANLESFHEQFVKNFYLELLNLREKLDLEIRQIRTALQEFEHIFYEIISPLGGVENWYGIFNSESQNFLRKFGVIYTVKDEFKAFISKYSDFAVNLKEILESIDMLYLNSQIISHKIRAKVPGIDILSSAIKIMVDKIEGDLNQAKNMEVVLEEIYKILDSAKLENLDVKLLEDALGSLQKIKFSVDNLASAVHKSVIFSLDNFSSVLLKLDEFGKFMLSVSQTFPVMIYNCEALGCREIKGVLDLFQNLQVSVRSHLEKLLEDLESYADKKYG